MAVFFVLMPLVLLPFIICEQVPPPLNPTVQAVNTNYTLLWNWFGLGNQTATFTVQYIAKFRLTRNQSNLEKAEVHWRTACKETPNMFCDLNPVNLLYLGAYSLRVCATVNGQRSHYVQVDFAPSKDAAVGPPTGVLLSHSGNDLEVSISEPQTISNTSMKVNIPSLYYRFLYWERHFDHKISQPPAVDSANAMVVLEDLKSWTWYCVSVQSRTNEPNRFSVFTDPVCISTQGGFRWGQFFGIFGICLILVLVIVLLILLGSYYSKQSLKKQVVIKPVFLEEQNWHFHPVLLSSDSQPEQCDHLTVQSPSQEHDLSSVRPEWQSSNDSGIYTAKNKTTSEQTTNQNVEALGARDTCLTPKNTALIPDEGFEEQGVALIC